MAVAGPLMDGSLLSNTYQPALAHQALGVEPGVRVSKTWASPYCHGLAIE